ncbi:MAG TPA: prolyl oligopeptidase family serine peptidase [Pyrinomonadaceae bacterium]|nr:prolyl oligopeptidase family serine peptidase [Pyrinomonadaceae bacterium]
MSTTKNSGIAFSPDEEKILFTSDASGVLNAHEVKLSDRIERQLRYSSEENIQAISYLPNDERILISRDCGNRENSVLCVLDPDGKETVLTPGEEVQAYCQCWSLDQQSFYISTNERDPQVYDLYKVDARTLTRTLVYKAAENYYFCAISRDQNYILFSKSDRRADSNIFLYNVGSGEMKCLTEHDGDMLNCLPVFDRDAKAIYYITDKDKDFRYVRRLDLVSGESQCVETANGDIAWTFFSPDYRRRVTFWNDRSTTLRAMDIHDEETGSIFRLPGFSQQSITSATISPSGRRLAFYVNGDRSPGNIYVYDFETALTTQLTENLNPEIDPEDLVESETMSFRSFDNLEIPCLLWRPHDACGENPAPGLVWVHGGPGGRMEKGYKGRIQYLVNQGYVVLGVNYRGSSGFGKNFFAADHRKHGREPLWDCVAAKKYLARLDYVDPFRIGIIGSSFGGYMALAALTFHPDEFAVGVTICGLSNLVSFAKTMPKYWDGKRFYEKLGDPEKDEELLRAISPFFHADRIKKPVMILQGATDPRCPKEQSDEMVKAIRKNGGKVEYLVYWDEAHGFRKRKNAIHAYEAIVNFLNSNLK